MEATTTNWKIHYLGTTVQEFPNSTLMDLIWHLGAKYGGLKYNLACGTGSIVINEEDKSILIKPSINDLVVKSPYIN